MRQRGTGSVIKLKMKDKAGNEIESRYFYILYYHNGRKVRESSKSESRMVAEKLLQRRMGEAGLGMAPEQEVKNVRYEDVRAALLAEFKNKHKGSLYTRVGDGKETLCGLDHLDKFFARTPVTNITTDLLRKYIEKRQKAGAADATIRRNLSILRSMLHLARKEGRLRSADVPFFPMPADSEPRQGFLNPDLFAKLRAALPAHLRPLVVFIYYTGCRLGAATRITWKMVSQDCTEVLLPGEITKSGEPLTLPLVGAGLEEVAKTLRSMFRVDDGPVFETRGLRLSWMRACNKVGLGTLEEPRRIYRGLTIHDLRRSAVRNLIRAGVSRGVAMNITGHKTEAVFERYNITETADIKDALIRVGKYVKASRRAS